jgi:nitrate reductase assembly molybdenum cofactor insertion protein NarJ
MALADFSLLAHVFDYPVEGYGSRILAVTEKIGSAYPEAEAELELFVKPVSKMTVDEIQELYTRTFDIQPITTLDVGFVMFGDDYKRGELLSNLNREHNSVGNDCGNELADHLPNLLRLIAILGKCELTIELIDMIVAPAIRAMVREFDPARVAQKNKYYKKQYKTLIESSEVDSAVYVHAISACYTVIATEFDIPDLDAVEVEHVSDFLKAIRVENATEKAQGS